MIAQPLEDILAKPSSKFAGAPQGADPRQRGGETDPCRNAPRHGRHLRARGPDQASPPWPRSKAPCLCPSNSGMSWGPTPAQANRVLIQGNVRRYKRKKKVDKMAAAILLQVISDSL